MRLQIGGRPHCWMRCCPGSRRLAAARLTYRTVATLGPSLGDEKGPTRSESTSHGVVPTLLGSDAALRPLTVGALEPSGADLRDFVRYLIEEK